MIKELVLASALSITPALAADLAPKKPVESTDKTTTEDTTTETTVDKTMAPTELHAATKLEKEMNDLLAKKAILDKKISVLQEKIDAEHSAAEKMNK